MELLSYLLKVSACTVLFFAFYVLVLRKLTFFKTNRFYLLFTLLLSFAIPALNFTIEREVVVSPMAPEPAVFLTDETLTEQHQAIPHMPLLPVVEERFDYRALIPYVYFTVVLSLLGIAIWRILQLLKHTKNSTQKINGLRIVRKAAGFTNCSFFNYVFIDDKLTPDELQVLLKHEEVHAKQLHSVDKVILIFFKSLLWFNPVVYLYDKALEQAHEYEADDVASKTFGNHSYAGLLLKLAVGEPQNKLIHNFVKSPVKERIKMLFNSKSKNMKKLAYLLVTPLVLGLIWGFTVEVVEVFPTLNAKEKFTIVLDAGHGGNKKGVEVNGFTEKALTLSIAKKIEALAQSKGINVVMTRKDDNEVSFKDRIAANGDVLISLHINSEPTVSGGNRNGIEMYTALADGSSRTGKANSLTDYLLKGIQNLQGINITEKIFTKSFALLRESKVPSVVLELGYLTNKNDFKFITSEEKQNELAEGILKGILMYKQAATSSENRDYKSSISPVKYKSTENDPILNKTIKGVVDSVSGSGLFSVIHFKVGNTIYLIRNDVNRKVSKGEELTLKISGRMNEMRVLDKKTNREVIYIEKPVYTMSEAFTAKGESLIKAQENHPFLYEANKARFTTSKIESIKRNSTGYVSEIVLNDGSFKIAFDVAALKTKAENFKIGNEVTAKFIGERLTAKNTYATNKLITLYSASKKDQIINSALYNKFYSKEGFQIVRGGKPKPLQTTTIPEDQVKIVSASETKNYASRGITNLKNAVLQIGKTKIEAEKVTLDSKNGSLIAEMATIYFSDGKIKKSKVVMYDIKKQAFTFHEFAFEQKIEEKKSIISGPGKEGELEFSTGMSTTKIAYSNLDSVKVRKLFNNVMLTGKARLELEKYKIEGKLIHIDNTNNMVVVYLGSVIDSNKQRIEAEVIEIDLANNRYKTKNYFR